MTSEYFDVLTNQIKSKSKEMTKISSTTIQDLSIPRHFRRLTSDQEHDITLKALQNTLDMNLAAAPSIDRAYAAQHLFDILNTRVGKKFIVEHTRFARIALAKANEFKSRPELTKMPFYKSYVFDSVQCVAERALASPILI